MKEFDEVFTALEKTIQRTSMAGKNSKALIQSMLLNLKLIVENQYKAGSNNTLTNETSKYTDGNG